MPIQESFRREAFERLKVLCEAFTERIGQTLKNVDTEDLEFGVRLELRESDLSELWKRAVEDNNYMEVVFTEIMEHHDGAYLKITFRNNTGSCFAERYVSVRSSGRVEIGHALFMSLKQVLVRIEKKSEGVFTLFVKIE